MHSFVFSYMKYVQTISCTLASTNYIGKVGVFSGNGGRGAAKLNTDFFSGYGVVVVGGGGGGDNTYGLYIESNHTT